MKNSIDPRKAITVLAIVAVLAVGGYFLGCHIIGGQESGGSAAAVISPSPSPETTYEHPNDALPGGTAGKDAAADTTDSPMPSDVTEDAQVTETPAPEAVTPVPSEDSGSAAATTPVPGSTAPVTTPAPAGTTSPAADADSGSSDSTPAAGSTNSEGQKYVPGFGWMTPGHGEGTTVGSEGDQLTGEKVGTMG